ncbi:hypothetical protein G7Z17_g9555 [Cylindrodendrum hubeiense]|uniref:RBR-type E3 ubiquitin transferase n=1 Tax=Cylindrodendrum hubeiense TaxID=595255 RepID=A0A9P5L5K1_9HYPO|nr:hypothetical protein G7Z17_g9555 [Cylindrodendrum hubeiense]
MFRNFKKRASTVFRKKKAPATPTDLPPDYGSIISFDDSTTTNTYTSTRDHNVVIPPTPRPPAVPPAPPAPPLTQRRPSPPIVVPPVTNPDPRGSDTCNTTDVPDLDSSPPGNNMLANGGFYGRINPDIMSGYGGDDDSIWLVDDEETDEEQQREDDEAPRETLGETQSQHNSDTRSESRSQISHRSSREEVPITQATVEEQAPSAPSRETAPPTFRYNVPALLDDDEFTSLSTTTPETPPPEPTPVPRRGYAPISASILNLTNMDVEELEEPPTEAPKSRDNTTPPASSSSSVNPYVALLEQRDDAMRVAYLRRLDQYDDVADDFRCPECRELLEYADIQRYANKQTFVRYETLALRAAMSEADNFVWCTSSCGSGQIHESGEDQPIVTCLHCNHRSCFHHNVPWHENLSCEEYDELLADPENFRSRLELDNEAWSESQRAQLEADRAMAQNMLADEQAEMQRREERARQEREQARKAAELVRKIAARRKREEQQSEATVASTTKPCPGCGWAIEKNDGCSHMTCPSCQFQWCFECGANHREIMAGDNTAHKETCKFHPDNMEEEEWN